MYPGLELARHLTPATAREGTGVHTRAFSRCDQIYATVSATVRLALSTQSPMLCNAPLMWASRWVHRAATVWTVLITRQRDLHPWRERDETQHQPRELLTILLHPGAINHHIIQDGCEALLRERRGQQALMTDVEMNLSPLFFEGVLTWPDRSRDNALLQAIAFNVDATGILLRQRTSRGGFAGTRDAIDDPDIHHTGSHISVGLTPSISGGA